VGRLGPCGPPDPPPVAHARCCHRLATSAAFTAKVAVWLTLQASRDWRQKSRQPSLKIGLCILIRCLSFHTACGSKRKPRLDIQLVTDGKFYGQLFADNVAELKQFSWQNVRIDDLRSCHKSWFLTGAGSIYFKGCEPLPALQRGKLYIFVKYILFLHLTESQGQDKCLSEAW